MLEPRIVRAYALLALVVLSACASPTEPLSSPAPLHHRAPSWGELELSIGGSPVRLPLAAASPPATHTSSRAVLVLVDDLFRPGEDPTEVVPRDWLTDGNLVLVPLSRLLAAQGDLTGPLLERSAAAIDELGGQLRARGLGERIVLVADGLATPIGARAVAREATPFAAYVGAGQLTSMAASAAWRGVPDHQVAPSSAWWWWSLVRPGVEPPRADDPLAPFLDALAREELRSIDAIPVPMVLLAGADDPLIPEHHLQLWAGLVLTASIDVLITRGGHDVLRTSPHEVRDALWSLLRDTHDPCVERDPPPLCQVPRERWRGPTTSQQGPEVTSTRRYDALEGTLAPLPRTASEPERALACDPDVAPPSAWPTQAEHRAVARGWYPESYPGSDEILEPPALPRLFADSVRMSPPAAGEVGLMVCEVRDESGTELFGTPNVRAVLQLEGEPWIGSFGPYRGRAYVTIPALRLEPGASMRIRAKDVDVLIDDSLGSVELRYDGRWPLEAHDDAMGVTCRAISRPDTLRRLPKRLRRLARALDRLEHAIDRETTWPRELHWEAWHEVEPVVALLGWADPCARAWLDRFADARQRWFEARLRALDTRTRDASPAGAWVALSDRVSLRVTDAICGSPRRRQLEVEQPESFCRVDAQLRNTGTDEATLETLLGPALRPVMELANGETVALVPRDDVEPRGGPRDDGRGITDEAAVFGSPWRRDDRPSRSEPDLRLGRRSLAPDAELHVVWLGRARLRGAEVVLGFRPALLRLADRAVALATRPPPPRSSTGTPRTP